jgi:hypothetical protein
MTKNNDASINIGNNVNNSEILGGEIHAIPGNSMIGENDTSINIGGSVTSSSILGGKINESPHINNLKEEIQQLLSELAKDPRTAKEAIAIKIIKEEIRDKPILRQRLLSALKAGGIESLKVVFNHPFVSIPVETVKGFLEAGE